MSRSHAHEFAQPVDDRRWMRWTIACLYMGAGIMHLAAPDKLLLITPSWVPFAPEVILATGVFELCASVALQIPRLRYAAGLAMAVYAICVWPANIKHALYGVELPYITNSWVYHGPRLLLQPVIVWWALYAAQIIDWPLRRNQH